MKKIPALIVVFCVLVACLCCLFDRRLTALERVREDYDYHFGYHCAYPWRGMFGVNKNPDFIWEGGRWTLNPTCNVGYVYLEERL